ncbi:MAG TPA: hypothetical protein VJ944_05155, partial [Thermoplasmataceae archaeon]|nr:hypothetical protein [Thermoplasmataceae archaeon]
MPSGYSLLNYQILVRNNNLYGVIGNTVLLTALALTIEFALALATSLLLNRAIRGRSIFRTIVILPYGVSTVVSAIAFTFIFAPTGWYLNEIFNVLGLAHTQ